MAVFGVFGGFCVNSVVFYRLIRFLARYKSKIIARIMVSTIMIFLIKDGVLYSIWRVSVRKSVFSVIFVSLFNNQSVSWWWIMVCRRLPSESS